MKFESPGAVADALRSADYLPDERIAQVVFLADRLDKPRPDPTPVLRRSR